MGSCYSCKRCELIASGDAVCVSDDGVQHLVLKRGEYDSLKEFKGALYDSCGLSCVKYEVKSKADVDKRGVKAVDVSGGKRGRFCDGWDVAIVLGVCLVSTYVLVVLGVL